MELKLTFYDDGVLIEEKIVNGDKVDYIPYPNDKDESRHLLSTYVHHFIRDNYFALVLDDINIKIQHKDGTSPYFI